MKIVFAALGIVALAVGSFYAYAHSEFTDCYAAFDSRHAAERAATTARVAGYDTEVEPSGPNERRPTSEGQRRIAVTFSDGETGEDGTEFRRTFGEIVEREDGVLEHSGNGGCTERGPFT